MLEITDIKNINLEEALELAIMSYERELENNSQLMIKDIKDVVVAILDEKPIGYMAITTGGENFLTENDEIYSICGAYAKKEYRSLKIANMLLDQIIEICKRDNKTYLGVDCETINPTALRFWGKHFTNYTYFFHRRIDERIYQYDTYFDHFVNNK